MKTRATPPGSFLATLPERGGTAARPSDGATAVVGSPSPSIPSELSGARRRRAGGVALALLLLAPLAHADLVPDEPRRAQLPSVGVWDQALKVDAGPPDAGPIDDSWLMRADGGVLPPRPPPSPEVLRDAMAGLGPKLLPCAEAEQQRHPGWVQTKATASLTLHPDGHASDVHLGPKTVDKSVIGQCVRKVLVELKVPQFDGDAVEVALPLVLARPSSGR